MNSEKLPYTIKHYWANIGISIVIATASNLLIGTIVDSGIARFVYLIQLVYWIIIEIRRFHDANRSGWLALINILPGLGTFTALILAGVLKSDYENNKWMKAKNSTEKEV